MPCRARHARPDSDRTPMRHIAGGDRGAPRQVTIEYRLQIGWLIWSFITNRAWHTEDEHLLIKFRQYRDAGGLGRSCSFQVPAMTNVSHDLQNANSKPSTALAPTSAHMKMLLHHDNVVERALGLGTVCWSVQYRLFILTHRSTLQGQHCSA